MQYPTHCALIITIILLQIIHKFETKRDIVNRPKTDYKDLIQHSHPQLAVELHREGFHKYLQYKVDFQRYYDECDFTIEQALPRAVYVDADELYDLVSRKGYNITFPTFVDIEKPTEDASGLSIMMHYQLKPFQVSIPIHFRYHSADKEGYVEVTISDPAFYITCSYWQISEDDMCFSEAKALPKKCGWKEVGVTPTRDASISAKIPRGDSSQGRLIFAVTVFTSWIGCFVILCSVYRKMKDICKKTE